MKYVSVTCNRRCEDLLPVIESLMGRVIFVDVEGRGIPGTAIGDIKDFCFELTDQDFDVAKTKKVIKGICTKCGLDCGQIRGLGDIVAKFTGLLGIKPCGGCKRRQETLNKLMPIGR